MLDYQRSRSLAVLSQAYAWFNALFRQCAPTPLPRHFYYTAGNGILTVCPSTTPFGFALGPD